MSCISLLFALFITLGNGIIGVNKGKYTILIKHLTTFNHRWLICFFYFLFLIQLVLSDKTSDERDYNLSSALDPFLNHKSVKLEAEHENDTSDVKYDEI